MNQKSSQDAKNIGARFRSARSLVPDLNRKSFCERHGINRYTMQSWENGLHVSKGRNVEKFIDALAREGVYCTSEWLIEGVGDPAKPLSGAPKAYPATDENAKGSVYAPKEIIDAIQSAYDKRGELTITFGFPMIPWLQNFSPAILWWPMNKVAKKMCIKNTVYLFRPDRRMVRKKCNLS